MHPKNYRAEYTAELERAAARTAETPSRGTRELVSIISDAGAVTLAAASGGHPRGQCR